MDDINWSLVPGYDCRPIESYYYPLFSKEDRVMLEEEMKALIKIQYVDSVAKAKSVATAIVGKRLKVLDA